MIDTDQLDFVGALLDPAAFLATVGYGRCVYLTMVNGRVVFRDGRLVGIDEDKLKREAEKQLKAVYENLPTA
jgi:hydroxyatrazine ethylaminohydrolase